MDFELFEGIVEMDETYFLYAEKGKNGISKVENQGYAVVVRSLEE